MINGMTRIGIRNAANATLRAWKGKKATGVSPPLRNLLCLREGLVDKMYSEIKGN